MDRMMDGKLNNAKVSVGGKELLKGREVGFPTDRNFRRRMYFLNEEAPTVRMVQYVHYGKQIRPHNVKRINASLYTSTSPRSPKRQRAAAAAAAPIPKLKETDIEFHHVEKDLKQLERQKNMHYKVVIVGAGCAGLGAARQLIDEQGMDPSEILVLEGGDRIGGRIHTKLFEAKAGLPPVRVDLGASYLHGYDFESYLEANPEAEKNPLQALVEKHGLAVKVDEGIQKAYSNGWLAHCAWFVNGNGKATMARRNFEYRTVRTTTIAEPSGLGFILPAVPCQ